MKQPFKKVFVRRKGLACLSGGKADTSSSPPHKRLFEREVLAQPKPAPWGRLSLLTFFDEAKKVSCPCGNEAQSKQHLQSNIGCLNPIETSFRQPQTCLYCILMGTSSYPCKISFFLLKCMPLPLFKRAASRCVHPLGTHMVFEFNQVPVLTGFSFYLIVWSASV
ncbi:MAG: hypothetical protein Q4G42_00930 [Neisseria sp.]|nr:hypothetical protein [Neisseria sp.]